MANTITDGEEALETNYSPYLPPMSLAVLVPLPILALIVSLHCLSRLVLLVTAPVIALMVILTAKRPVRGRHNAARRRQAHAYRATRHPHA